MYVSNPFLIKHIESFTRSMVKWTILDYFSNILNR